MFGSRVLPHLIRSESNDVKLSLIVQMERCAVTFAPSRIAISSALTVDCDVAVVNHCKT